MYHLAMILGVECAALGIRLGYYKARAIILERRALAAQRVAENALEQLRKLRDAFAQERKAQAEHVSRVRSTAKAAAQIEQRLHTDDAQQVADALNDALEL